MVGKLVDDAARTRIPDVELALNQRNGRAAFRGHSSCGAREERIELALLHLLPSLPLRVGAFFENFLHVARVALRLPEGDDGLELRVAYECALDSGGLTRVNRLIEHVAATKQLLRPARTEADTAWDRGATR